MRDTRQRHFGPEIQGAIYLRGLGGVKPEIPTTFIALEAAAKAKMAPEAWAYTAGGAGLESIDGRQSRCVRSLSDPAARCSVRRGNRDLSVAKYLGVKVAAPILSSPIGVLEMMHPDADLAVARAMQRLNLPMIISSQASFPMEEIAEANGSGPRLLSVILGQFGRDRGKLRARAEAIGCKAIFITLDTTILGWRPRDLNAGVSAVPGGQGIAQYTSDPAVPRAAAGAA